MEDTKVTVWAGLSRTIQIKPYEPIKIDIGMSGIPVGASSEWLAEQLDAANKTLHEVVESLAKEMTRRLRDDLGV